MSEGDQDHSGVPVTIAVVAYGLDQAFDLLLGQVLPCPQLLILQTPRNCSIYARWGDQLEAWLGHVNSGLATRSICIMHFLPTVVKPTLSVAVRGRQDTHQRLPAARKPYFI